ncbi:hypothetical protein F5Y18DRAFT_313256 [Xylariaceae sp. FL1019]|nr:hypothetical protein F5Y18DRAFT_313256 [Xylariaceae sp. FL1019]
MLPDPSRTTLGPDPIHRRCAINGYAFQQDALHTYNGWQYACFYASSTDNEEPLYVHLSRRKLQYGEWETIVFKDYAQTTDDGHNTVQLGICPGDGTIHLSYDHHCDVLRYRHSLPGVASSPDDHDWTPKLFTDTLSSLPGLSSPDTTDLLSYITYPRFVARGQDLLFTFRTGKAGLGDDHLCVYTASANEGESDIRTYTLLGTHLKGVQNNPYIHSLSVCPVSQDLVTTWVYRDFVHYEGWDDPLDTKHKAQAGPNGAENNHDICYASSPNGGLTWLNAKGETIADLRNGESILPSSKGVTVWNVEKGKGLINQESQAVDQDGACHVLNRDCVDGEMRWRHYHLDAGGTATSRPLPFVEGVYGGKRGQVAVAKNGDLFFVLPHHAKPELSILRARKENGYKDYALVWRGEEFPPCEPLVDKVRLERDDVLSVFTKVASTKREGGVDLVVLDFRLCAELCGTY